MNWSQNQHWDSVVSAGELLQWPCFWPQPTRQKISGCSSRISTGWGAFPNGRTDLTVLCCRLREFNSADVTDCASWPQCQRMIPGTVQFISTDLAFISRYFPYPSDVKLVPIPPSHQSLYLCVTVMWLIIPHQHILWAWPSIGVRYAFYLNPWIFDNSIFHFPLCSYLMYFFPRYI